MRQGYCLDPLLTSFVLLPLAIVIVYFILLLLDLCKQAY